MEQVTYEFFVMRTANTAELDADEDSTFFQAATVIEGEGRRNGVVFAHVSHTNLPQRTAEKLARMVGCKTILAWGYWGSTEEFAQRVVRACPKKQPLILVGHETLVDKVLLEADIGEITETPRLVLYGLHLVVTKKFFREPTYKLEPMV